jgi:hypothetical protein
MSQAEESTGIPVTCPECGTKAEVGRPAEPGGIPYYADHLQRPGGRPCPMSQMPMPFETAWEAILAQAKVQQAELQAEQDMKAGGI